MDGAYKGGPRTRTRAPNWAASAQAPPALSEMQDAPHSESQRMGRQRPAGRRSTRPTKRESQRLRTHPSGPASPLPGPVPTYGLAAAYIAGYRARAQQAALDVLTHPDHASPRRKLPTAREAPNVLLQRVEEAPEIVRVDLADGAAGTKRHGNCWTLERGIERLAIATPLQAMLNRLRWHRLRGGHLRLRRPRLGRIKALCLIGHRGHNEGGRRRYTCGRSARLPERRPGA